MILKDKDLIIRAIDEKDAEGLLEMINDKDVEDFVVGWSLPVSMKEQLQWISNVKNDSKNIRLTVAKGEEMIGFVSITNLDFKNRTANLNVKIRGFARGQGYATRALKMLIKYGFEELNLNCLTAGVLEDNIASNKLFEGLGFVKEGILRARVFKRNRYINLVSYSYLREEYNERNW